MPDEPPINITGLASKYKSYMDIATAVSGFFILPVLGKTLFDIINSFFIRGIVWCVREKGVDAHW